MASLTRAVPRGRFVVSVLAVALVAFLGYRMVRPMNIFVVGDAFAHPIPVTQAPEGLSSLSAAACGRCHTDIYEEWAGSMHAQAWTDPYFQVDFAFDGSQQICLNCHTPLENQQPHRVLGFRDSERFDPVLEPNEAFDTTLRDEGVTCAVCHVEDGAILGPYGDTRPPHPTRRDPAMTDGISVCQRCHVVSGNRWDTFYRIPPCGTVAEIREGTGEAPDCMGCHMPEVTRPVVPAGPPRRGRRHLWRGGHDPATVRGALDVDVTVAVADDGKSQQATVTLTNVGAGHDLPTGTPDRHMTLDITLRGADGTELRRAQHALERTIMWRPFIVDLWDTRLPVRQPRAYDFSFRTDTDPAPVMLDISVRYYLLDEARRSRIGYENEEPISYIVHDRRLPVRVDRGAVD